MFALLEHTTHDGVHWDLLVEVPGRPLLATWRLARNPLESADPQGGSRGPAGVEPTRSGPPPCKADDSPIAAEPIGEHRRTYLDYEGPISGDRGSVRRVDRGPAEVLEAGPPRWRLRLDGQGLRGVFEIGPAGTVGLVFRRVEQPARNST